MKVAMLALVGIGALAGCQANVPAPVERLNDTPLVVDDAMQRREWDRSTVYYGNGDTIAGGTAYMFQVHETMPNWSRRAADPLVATTNFLLLPVGVFVNSPFDAEAYQGAVIPPTHTAQPVLP